MTKEKTYLKVEELKPCYLYRIKARNGTVGLWNPTKGQFTLSRYKFGDNYTFGEVHWDLDTSFGTVKPWEELEKSPFELEDLRDRVMVVNDREFWGNPKEEELLKYLNEWEHKLNDPHPKERYND
jgi:hypothetical protein